MHHLPDKNIGMTFRKKTRSIVYAETRMLMVQTGTNVRLFVFFCVEDFSPENERSVSSKQLAKKIFVMVSRLFYDMEFKTSTYLVVPWPKGKPVLSHLVTYSKCRTANVHHEFRFLNCSQKSECAVLLRSIQRSEMLLFLMEEIVRSMLRPEERSMIASIVVVL